MLVIVERLPTRLHRAQIDPGDFIHISFRRRVRVYAIIELTFRLWELIALDRLSQCQDSNMDSRPYQHPSPRFLCTKYPTYQPTFTLPLY